jgi:hypothetical protein
MRHNDEWKKTPTGTTGRRQITLRQNTENNVEWKKDKQDKMMKRKKVDRK